MTFVVNEYEDEVWPMRARTANEVLNGFAHVRAEGYRMHLPIYSHHGQRDSLAEVKVGPLRQLLVSSSELSGNVN